MPLLVNPYTPGSFVVGPDVNPGDVVGYPGGLSDLDPLRVPDAGSFFVSDAYIGWADGFVELPLIPGGTWTTTDSTQSMTRPATVELALELYVDSAHLSGSPSMGVKVYLGYPSTPVDLGVLDFSSIDGAGWSMWTTPISGWTLAMPGAAFDTTEVWIELIPLGNIELSFVGVSFTGNLLDISNLTGGLSRHDVRFWRPRA